MVSVREEQPEAAGADTSEHGGKRVSFVELYLDLIFVLAVGRVAHLMVEEPRAREALLALGLFAALWWTWIGFVVLYNRYGVDTPRQRLAFLAATIPGGVAAIAVEPAAHGDSVVLAISFAAIRVVLAVANQVGSAPRDILRERVSLTYLFTAAMFGVSIAAPAPWRYVVWGLAIALESGTLLDDARSGHEGRRGRAARRGEPHATPAERREARAAQHQPRGTPTREDLANYAPTLPGEALDAQHFAERFGLFLIILLGEVVIEAGAGALEVEHLHSGQWFALVAAMLLAAALWWLYFDATAEVSEEILRLAGGSPVIARGIFAVGHMFPAFSLLLIAAGVGLLVEGESEGAYRLACTGIGIYLIGTRVFLGARTRISGVLRVGVLIATFELWRLKPHLDEHEYLWLLAVWTVLCAAFSVRRPPGQRGTPPGGALETEPAALSPSQPSPPPAG